MLPEVVGVINFFSGNLLSQRFLRTLLQFPVNAPCIISVLKGPSKVISIADQCCLPSKLFPPIVPKKALTLNHWSST